MAQAGTVLNIAAIIAIYNSSDFVEAAKNTSDAFNAKEDLGPIPEYPNVVITDSDWNTPDDARAIWFSNIDSANQTIKDCKDAQVIFEKQLFDIIPENQWIKMTGLSLYTSNLIQWIGVKNVPSSSQQDFGGNTFRYYYIVVSLTQPTQNFPNI